MLTPLTEFIRFCRKHGLPVGQQQLQEAIQMTTLFQYDKNSFRYGLQAICCKTKSEYDKFSNIFDEFWKKRKSVPERTEAKSEIKKQPFAPSLVFLGQQESSNNAGKKQQAKEVTGASNRERLKTTDFSVLQNVDEAALLALAEKLWQEMLNRIRRRKTKQKRGVLDLRKTIRKGISSMGFPHHLYFTKRKQEKRHLLLLLDVSGSMDKYSFYLFKFIMILRDVFKNMEAFTFSTKLTRITHLLDKRLRYHPSTLHQFSKQLNAWSGGTKMASCFNHFLDVYSHKYLPKNSVVIILSDGLETDHAEELGRTIKNIRRRCRTLIWLNPLRGMKGYQPIQRGMAASLPFIDVFASAHSLKSLLQLEHILKSL